MAAITVTNGGLNMIRDGMLGANNSKLLFFAVGNSATAPSVTDTHLGNETFRKAITSYSVGTTGEILVSVYLGPTDAVGLDIEEVGIFGGNTATTSPNTGVLLAHGLFIHNPKLNTESIVMTLDLVV